MPSAHPDTRTATAFPAPTPARAVRAPRHTGLPLVAVLVVVVTALAGCGGSAGDAASGPSGTGTGTTSTSGATTSSPSSTSSDPSASSTHSTPPTTGATPAMRTVTVTVTGRKVSPPPGRVDLARGEQLLLVVTVDRDDQLHVHGFDVEEDMKKGVPLKVTLTGGDPGLYDVETHHPELRLLQIAVR